MSVDPQKETPKNTHKRNLWLMFVAFIFLLVMLLVFLYWLLVGRFYVTTDDAYVMGNEVKVCSQVSGSVCALYADNTDYVEKGQLIAHLDTTDYCLRFEEKKEELANTVRQVAVLFETVKTKQAQLEVRKAEEAQAQLDFEHRKLLWKTGAVSIEEYETFQTRFYTTQALTESSSKELTSAEALVKGTTLRTHPLVEKALLEAKEAYLNLIRCTLRAPERGYIAKRRVQVGNWVNPGELLLFIVPLDQIWLEANYKETQLRRVRIGQPVAYSADLYGSSIDFHGKIVGFQPGSGNAFALLPSQNASGNWIKIIQRVPVKIAVDPEEILKHPLFLGLSLKVRVDVHDSEGGMLAEVATCEPLYTTWIYQEQEREMAKIVPVLEEIITQNSRL